MGNWLILAATLAAFNVPPERANGGDTREFTQHVKELDASGTPVRVLVSECFSSCTFYLFARNVCIAPMTRFHFHGPFDSETFRRTGQRGLSAKVINETLLVMTRNYETRVPGLGNWFAKNAAHLWGTKYATLTGSQIRARFNIPYC